MARPRSPVRYPWVNPERENTASSWSSRAWGTSSPSAARRQAETAAATYSGRFIRPSILAEHTPACFNCPISRTKDKSFRERSWPVPPGAAKGRRQGWAHRPRLPLRPPSKALNKHCPETDMHSAPWTKLSSWMGQAWWTSSISPRDISRESTARSAPKSHSSFTPAGVWRLIWVEACRGSWGARCRSKENSPMSCTSTASTGRVHKYSTNSNAWGSSFSFSKVFTVTWTRTPRAWQNRTASASCSREKFWALARAPKAGPPRYTASAPAYTAARRGSGPPAGANTSKYCSFISSQKS